MTTATAQLICDAIRRRRLLEFEYGARRRIVAPYCHGRTERGAAVLRAIQLRGDSGSGGFGFGKLWTLDKMTDVRVLDETFEANDPHYNPDDSAMSEIHCRV